MSLIPWTRRQPQSLYDSIFEDWLRPTETFRGKPALDQLPEVFRRPIPPLDISEDERTFSVSVELPGMSEEDIEVKVMGNQLMISGEKKFSEDKKEKDFHRIESQYGSFSRSIPLMNAVRVDSIQASYDKGVLTVTIPKVEPTPSSRIEVKKG